MTRKEVLLNLGSGVHLYSNFINVDKYFTLDDLKRGIKTKKGLYQNAIIEEGSEFVQADICNLPFDDNFADYIECIDVIEHLPFRNVSIALQEMYRVLKSNGELVLFTNDFDNLAQLWVDHMKGKPFNTDKYIELTQLIYGNQLGKGEFHTAPFNRDILFFLLCGVGFNPKKLKMTLYPHRSQDRPPFRGQKWPDTYLEMRSDMLFVRVKK